MSLVAMPKILVEWDEHNDSGSYQRKDDICRDFFAV